MASGDVELNVLGPWQLLVGGEPIDIGRRQVRQVLTRLTLGTGPVGVDALLSLVWADSFPADPRAALSVIISRSRTALGDAADHLELLGDRYRFTAGSDLERLASIVEATSVGGSDRIRSLRRALALRRGEPFDGLPEHPVFEYERRRAESLFSRARRELGHLLVEAGRFEEVVTLLQPLCDEWPDLEVEATCLARALASIGQRRDALAVIARLRRSVSVAGLDSSERLVALEQLILTDGVDLSQPLDGPPPEELFIGRSSELEQLTDPDRPRVSVVVGEAGIGKSTLLEAAKERWMARGQTVVAVRVSATPNRLMEPLASLLDQLIDNESDGHREAFTAAHRDVLSVVVPERLVDARGWSASRDELIDGLVRAVSELAGSNITVVIDDGQWIDSLSSQVLRRVVRSSTASFVISGRKAPDFAPEDSSTMRLDPLDVASVSEWLRKEVEDPRVLGTHLHQQTGGNPLFLRLLIDLLIDDLDESLLPTTVLAVVEQRLGALSGPARRLITTAGVLGETVPLALLQTVCGDIGGALDEVDRAGLARVDAGVLRFQHALVSDAVGQMAGEGGRMAVNDAAADAASRAGRPAVEFWKPCVATWPLDPDRALRVCVEAAESYALVYAWEELLECIDAVAAADGIGLDHERQLDLRILEARASFGVGRPGGEDLLRSVADAAASLKLVDVEVRAITELSSRGCFALLGLDADGLAVLIERGMQQVANPTAAAWLAGSAARSLGYSRHHQRGQALFRSAFRSMPDVDDRRVRWAILRNAEYGLADPVDLDEAERACNQMDAEMGTNPEIRFLVAMTRFRHALIRGDATGLLRYRQAAAEAESLAARTDVPLAYGHTYAVSIQHAWIQSGFEIIRGDFEAAERFANRSLELGEQLLSQLESDVGRPWIMVSYGALLVAIRNGQGRLHELAPMASDLGPTVPAWRAAVVATKLAAGEAGEAARILELIADQNFAGLVPDQTMTGAIYLLAAPVAQLLERPEVEQLYRRVLPLTDRFSCGGVCTLGPLAEAAAVLAEALGLDADAAEFRR
ncbi:MAG: AAA family ATPase, partial [Ilumatobacter sp.]